MEKKEVNCSRCDGTGKCQQTDIDWDDCRACNGTGSITIEVPQVKPTTDKPDLEGVELTIVDWLKSDNENATYCAHLICEKYVAPLHQQINELKEEIEQLRKFDER